MFVDHANTLFLKHPDPLLYALGRMAFPLYILIWAMNVQRSPSRLQKRANRLWGWALITQPIFSLTFQHHQPWYALNILFVFAGVTQFLALKYKSGKKGVIIGVLLLAIMVWPLQPASYGLPGIMLSLGMVMVYSDQSIRVGRAGTLVSLFSLCCLNGVSHLVTLPADTLLFATLPTILFPLMVLSVSNGLGGLKGERFMPSHFFYYAYTGHLFIMAFILKAV
ncbi:conjugal transfer protein TraX [Salmonella enterica]|nr:conjugal transfer protein TraX [Salmonella enterica]EEH5466055.1 conjugal transfer protein TraX [Salmonella enterica]EEH7555499.1 conjugal transfer protein TraX [Salmonella enterica]EEO5639863.1 conjugal transfer protein TraX [Salmonella enterica]EEQ0204449.1 conjugal transfer protein TraX [Salmonella enterica]